MAVAAEAGRVVDELADRFASSFPARARSPRWVGREAEYPLVTPDGRAGDASRLWAVLLEEGGEPVRDVPPGGEPGAVVGVRGDGWECLVEVGRCTVEVVTGPRRSLNDLARDHERALARILPAVDRAGYRLLGFGIQPRTPPGRGLLSAKRRYPYLVEATSGRWLSWCVTASDQAHVDAGRDELVALMNTLNALSGAVIAFTANSSVYRGRPGAFACGREGLMEDVTGEAYRHGAVPRAFAGVDDYVRFVLGFRCLFLPDGRGGYELVQGPLGGLEGPSGFERFLFHDHYWWPSARPRAHIGTLEVRPACQQPAGATWTPAALATGLAEAHREASALLEDRLGPDPGPALLRFRRLAARDGLRAREPAPAFLADVLALAERGLRSRGLGEEPMLAALRDRLERRAGPADDARRLVGDRGVRGLLDAAALG
jgi:gamma-glutamylcysteine synthetase